MTDLRVLVAGIGNVFLGDDAFGVEVAARLVLETLPDGVVVADFGIRGIHLAYELLDGYDVLVLVDAVPMGEPPGTLAVIEAEYPPEAGEPDGGLDAHSMSPVVVLTYLAHLGGTIDRVLVVGCQPATLEEGIGLSAAVAAAVGSAVDLVRNVIADMFASTGMEIPS